MRRAAISLFLIALGASAPVPEALALTGQITHLSGAVVARRDDGMSRILSQRSEVREGDLLLTADNSYARIRWADGTDIVLRPNTQLKIDAVKFEEGRPQEDNFAVSLIKGGMRSVTGLLARRNADKFRVATPNATIGVRGTNFGALFCREDQGKNDCEGVQSVSGATPAAGLHLDVSDGVIIVASQAGAVEFKIGDFGFVQGPNILPVLVPPDQGTRVNVPSQLLNTLIQGGTVGKGGELECKIQ